LILILRKQQYRDGELVSSYTFYTSAEDGRPLKLHMFGANPSEIGVHTSYLTAKSLCTFILFSNPEVIVQCPVFHALSSLAPHSVAGAHFDEYIYEFSVFAPLAHGESDRVFAVPDLCKDVAAQPTETTATDATAGRGGRHWLSMQMDMLAPSARVPNGAPASAWAPVGGEGSPGV
jgi:hypothetical protein